MSLSLHAAAHRQAYLLFATVLSITGVLFYLFQIKWLVPEFHLSLAYKMPKLMTFAARRICLVTSSNSRP